MNAETKEIAGADKVEKIKLLDKNSGEEKEISLDGVFIEVGRIASTDIVSDLVERNDRAQIIVNTKTETKTPGLFAAGDVTDTEYKQITVAIGQATTAALSAYQYLQLKEGKKVVVKNY